MLGASLAKVGVLAVGGKDQRSSDTRWKCRAVETVEKSSKPKRTFPPFPPRLEISQKTRDSHIPTALRAVPCQEEQKPPLDTADLLMDAATRRQLTGLCNLDGIWHDKFSPWLWWFWLKTIP